MLNKLFRIILILFLTFQVLPLKEAEAWVSGYTYRRAITIDNTGYASALTDYQVKVTNPVYDETGLVGSWHMEEGL